VTRPLADARGSDQSRDRKGAVGLYTRPLRYPFHSAFRADSGLVGRSNWTSRDAVPQARSKCSLVTDLSLRIITTIRQLEPVRWFALRICPSTSQVPKHSTGELLELEPCSLTCRFG
jgi:hypothetical protein